MKPFPLNATIDLDVLESLVRDNMFGLGNWGVCRNCGEEQEGCEPDALNYPCEACGENAVQGADDLLMELA